jgi:DMSO reductase anchor subunit
MLTLMPVAVGFALAAALLPATSQQSVTYYVTLSSAVAGAIGLGASVFHLGQPLRAWRIFLGWRKSWLSREAMIFGAWFPLALLAAVAPSVTQLSALNSQLLTTASAAVGLLGLFCSAMIYIDTRRHFWRAAQTLPRFFGTALLVTLTLTLPHAAAVALLVKLAWESRTRYDGSVSARLQRGPLAALGVARDSLALCAMVLLLAWPGWTALAFLVAGELLERTLFFRAVDAPKMPGMPA